MRAYEQTPAGKAARQRQRATWAQRRKEQRETHWTPDVKPLATALSNWR
jgi:hypothetical protein